jgi:hypothetical protein
MIQLYQRVLGKTKHGIGCEPTPNMRQTRKAGFGHIRRRFLIGGVSIVSTRAGKTNIAA